MNDTLPPVDMHRWDSFVLIVYGFAILIFGGYLLYLWRSAQKLRIEHLSAFGKLESVKGASEQ